jgi:hypothetical protein
MIKRSVKAQAEYAWLFSLIIGAMILFLAIILSGKIFSTGTYLTEAEVVRSFDIILNPFSSAGSIASLTLSKPIELPYNTELNFSCSSSGQTLMLRQVEKGKNNDWVSYTIKNKYIFTEKNISGKTFWAFSKPFEMPWRVDDLIYIISGEYCFVSPPEKIREELEMINATPIKIEDVWTDCSRLYPKAKIVCFDYCGRGIQITGDMVVKEDDSVMIYADDATLYAAIFADKQIYDCNIYRLMKRLSLQTDILLSLSNQLSANCNNQILRTNLNSLNSTINVVMRNQMKISDVLDIAASVKNSDSYDCPIIKK